MAFKFITVFALVAVVNGGLLPAAQYYHAAPAAKAYHTAPASVVKTVTPVLAKVDDEFDPHPQYKYDYNVQDSVSGDSKSQVEERDGDVVRGEYSLIDADGFKRTVKYTADDHNGFNAVVHREPLVKAPATVVKTLTPVVHYAAPAAVVKTVTPEAHYAEKHTIPAYTTYSVPAHH